MGCVTGQSHHMHPIAVAPIAVARLFCMGAVLFIYSPLSLLISMDSYDLLTPSPELSKSHQILSVAYINPLHVCTGAFII